VLSGQYLDKSDANVFVENAYRGYATGALVGGVAATLPHQFSYDSPPIYTARAYDIGLRTTWQLPFATLTSLSHEQWEHDLRGFDVDGTSLPIEVVHFPGTSNTASEELQLVSKSQSRLQWLAGALYYYDHDTQAFNLLVPAVAPLFEGYLQTNSAAVYGDLSYNIWKGLFLTAGARYSHDALSEEFTPNGGPSTRANIDYQRVSPRADLRYDFSKESSVYASFSTGYKTGGYNPNGLSTLPVKPETIKSYEVGYKQSGASYHFEAAAFYYDYSNLQVNQYLGDITVLLNAARARIYGAELGGYFNIFKHLTVGGGLSYTHARYASFPNAPEYLWEPQNPVCPFPPPKGTPNATGICIFPNDASGNPLTDAPDFTAKFDVTYRHDLPYGGLRVNANVSYQSTTYFDPYKQTQQDGYGLLNLRATWISPDRRYDLSVFCDNCTDKSYIDALFTQPIIFDQHWAPPRVVGVDLKVHL
jgi:iron complex outermembrane receptor protein